MYRAFMIYMSRAAWARRFVTNWKLAWRAASRFIAGEKLDDAIRVVRELNATGISATLDHLGENTTNPEESRIATEAILSAIAAINETGVRANFSVKLTQIGLALDAGLCAQNLRCILQQAKEHDIFVRIDMEDSPWVDQTLALYRQMQQEGLANTGLVIQAYLYRSAADVEQILAAGGRIRLCKGAYKEPAAVAFQDKKDVDRNYDRLAEMMIDIALVRGAPQGTPDGKIPPIPAIASHDPARLVHAKEYALQKGLPKSALEFQMLHGIRRDLQEKTVQEGYPVRIYVPYGREWYPYYVRRLAERPANLWFFVSNFFHR